MNNNIYEIIALLADGKARSGQEIGDQMKITRSAVWKIMNKLNELGIPVERQQGKGYRFTRPVQMLEKDQVWQRLPEHIQRMIPEFELLESTDSANSYMLNNIRQGKPSGSALLCEHQTAGKSRLGRPWHSPYAATITLALYWHFEKDTSELSGLSQVISSAVLMALTANQVPNLLLGWPNNIYHQGKKVATTLITMIAEPHCSTQVVISVSVNISMPSCKTTLDQPWTDVHTITGQFPDRNIIAASLLESIYTALTQFQREGFGVFAQQWAEHDGLIEKDVSASNNHYNVDGIAKGLGARGELMIETATGLVPFANGSVKLQAKKI